MPNIVILVHPQDPFDREKYLLRAVAELWRGAGMSVSVCRDPSAPVEAELAILHVDLTTVPAEYLACARRFPKAINAGVVDISKRRISRHLVRRGDGYGGPVIVKTDRNSGGTREQVVRAAGPRLRRCADAVRQRLPWSFRSRLPTSDYPVFDSPALVPRAVWFNPDLVVERFLPERDGPHYCLRTWVFLGDRETNSRSLASEPIIKGHNVVRRDVVDEVPDELRRVRREMGFDYGKFDYAVVDGRVVLYDVNRTPTLGGTPRDAYLPRVKLLAEGIHALL